MKLLSCASLLLFLLFSTGLHSQITNGSTLLGASFNFRTSKDENTIFSSNNNKIWSGDFQLGKAIANNRIAGVYVNTYNEKGENKSNTTNSSFTSHTYGGGLFYRSYFPMSARWYLFGQGNIGYNRNNFKRLTNDINESKSKGWDVNTSLSPGLSFAASRVVHLELLLDRLFTARYITSKTEYYRTDGSLLGTDKRKDFSVGANLTSFSSIYVGLRWIIPAKKKAVPAN